MVNVSLTSNLLIFLNSFRTKGTTPHESEWISWVNLKNLSKLLNNNSRFFVVAGIYFVVDDVGGGGVGVV